MTRRQRVEAEPAYVLHARPWRETSLLLEVLTLEHGRLALVAKGARRPGSRLRLVLLRKLGEAVNYADAPPAEIRAAIEACCG